MLERILNLDTRVFIYLNSLGSEKFDGFWSFLTSQINWIPFFLLILYLVVKNNHWKTVLLIVLFVGLTVLLTNETTDFFKESFERLRPNNEPFLAGKIRALKDPQSFSFISGHAANSTAVITFIYLLFRNKYRWAYLFFIWPLVFGYSRIYLGVHYPTDILAGYFWGGLMGWLVFSLYGLVVKSYLVFGQSEKPNTQHLTPNT